MRRPACAARAIIAFAAALVAGAPARGGGPLVVTTSGQPVGWSTAAPVPYLTDQGGLGTFDNAAAVALVDELFLPWQNVSTATIAYTRAGSLGVDVNASNFGPYLGPYGGSMTPLGQNAIVFDADGSIFDTLYGVGTGVLGFAGPTFFSGGAVTVPIGDPVPPGAQIIEGLAFLNGKWIDGVNDPSNGNYEISHASFETVFVHEFGHFSGLDHTQIHGLSLPATSDAPGYTLPVETMYPFLTDDSQSTLERDDVVALSALYPEASFAASTGRITGRIFTSSGVGLSGVNVIARNVVDDSDAVSYVSGYSLLTPGAFSLAGLTPGASYRVEVQEIDAFATGGSRVGPFSPPIIVPGPPEAYNGVAESADPWLDDPTAATPITATAGVTVANIDVTLNAQGFTPINIALDPGSFPQSFAIADYDGDMVLDFVAPQYGFSPGNVTRFYRGNGDGTFAAPVTIDAFPGNRFAVAGQFNAGTDTFVDVAVASDSLNDVRVYLGNGSGGFAAPTTILNLPNGGGTYLTTLAHDDLNGDGFDDLFTLALDSSAMSGTAYALLGSASGSFSTVTTALAAGSNFPRAHVELAQIAGSSALDAVGTASFSPAVIGILVGDGAGGFSVVSTPIPGISSWIDLFGLAAGDLDEDGLTDLVVANARPAGGPPNFTRSFIDILRGDGAGGFTLAHRYDVPESNQSAVAVADLDADTHLDIASTGAWYGPSRPGAKVTVAFGDGAGGIVRTETIWGVAEFPEGIAVGDFDGNGDSDLLVNDSVSSALGLSSPQYYSVLLQARCGNGSVEGSEQCDDGNPTSGDGCDANCRTTACGNGIVTAGEQCDDDNTANGDCCSSTCQYEPSGNQCPGDGLPCSTDVCNATGACTHAPSLSGTPCRPSAGVCDVAETCDGTATSCPTDAFATSGLCRPSAGVCDVAEACDGTTPSCPTDGFATSGECRAATDICDASESCDGSGPDCPTDGYRTSGECRPSAGICDVPESCDGSSVACPPDALQGAGVQCRAASEACDVAENCTGASADCPVDAFAVNGTPCRADAGACDVPEACTGTSSACPVDAKEPDGTPCNDADTCTQADTCQSGVCAGADPLDCDDENACSQDSCDPIGGCVNDEAPATGCLTSNKSLVLIKDSEDNGKDKLLWKWLKGAALDQMDLAYPTTFATYALCVYAGPTNALIAGAELPPGAGWSAVGSKGYKFKGTSPDGLTLALVKGGAAGKSKALAKGKGATLPDPALPVAYPVTVQLKIVGWPLCLESTFTADNEEGNTSTQFKARK